LRAPYLFHLFKIIISPTLTFPQVVVWYYDIAGAATGGVGEEEMRAHATKACCGVHSLGQCPPPLERSTVMEIREWILASPGTTGEAVAAAAANT
jgi:hypothetical protein